MTQPFADNGVILCTVIDSDDPDRLGNVRVQYPDYADRPSTWAPVSTMMASGDTGTWFRPKPGDQVLVAFERGDPKFPVVLGSIWSNADRPPPDDGAPGNNNWQQIVSRAGAILRFDDTPGAEKVELINSAGKLSVTLDTAGGKLVVRANEGEVEIVGGTKLTMSAPEIEMTAQNGITLSGGTAVTVSAQQIELN